MGSNVDNPVDTDDHEQRKTRTRNSLRTIAI